MKELTTEFESPADFTEKFINRTNKNLFLTGKAGTGKTTLLRKIIETTYKNTVVVAPTGIAALNAGGVTIHSFFQLPFGAFLPIDERPPFSGYSMQFNTKNTLLRHARMNRKKQDIMLKLELLIIDEVSMLRADLLDAIDHTLQKNRRDDRPFGGVQVLFIGDLLQLPPIVKDQEWSVLSRYYKGQFFFHSKVLEENPPFYIELEKIYRQSDQRFISVLNELRNNFISPENLELLNQYVQPDFDATKHEGYITLTTHNNVADSINEKALKTIQQKSFNFYAKTTGDFPENIYPIPKEMELKVGAQVMFIKNDMSYERRYFNGKIGVVSSLSADEIFVTFPEENKTIQVEPFGWENKKFTLDDKTGEIKEKTIGVFSHYPLKLAWAITVHKSQGLTFEKAVLDLSRVFAPGQAYVALSRLVSLDGLVLTESIQLNGLKNEADVVNYAKNKADKSTMIKALKEETAIYLRNRLQKTFNWEVMVTKWLTLESQHKQAGERSEMGKNRTIFEKQTRLLLDTLEPAKKFREQLIRICSQRPINLETIQERYEAAYTYFMEKLEPVFHSNLKQMVIIGSQSNAKQYFEDLAELDELITDVIGNLKKDKNLVQAIARGEEPTKNQIWDNEVRNFKIHKVEAVKNEVQRERPTLAEEADFFYLKEEVLPAKTKKKKESSKPKRVKGQTYIDTLELYKQGKSIAEIAKERSLTESTIQSHFAHWIKKGELTLDDALTKDRIQVLEEIFGDTVPEVINEAKAKAGDKVTYGEVRLYQASQSANT